MLYALYQTAADLMLPMRAWATAAGQTLGGGSSTFESWRAAGALCETLETAADWSNIAALKAAVTEALTRFADACVKGALRFLLAQRGNRLDADPQAMRRRRDALMISGLVRSSGVIDRTMASMRLRSLSSGIDEPADFIKSRPPGSIPRTPSRGPILRSWRIWSSQSSMVRRPSPGTPAHGPRRRGTRARASRVR